MQMFRRNHPHPPIKLQAHTFQNITVFICNEGVLEAEFFCLSVRSAIWNFGSLVSCYPL